MKDLMEAFRSDLATKVISPKVWEEIALIERQAHSKDPTMAPTSATVTPPLQSSSACVAAQSIHLLNARERNVEARRLVTIPAATTKSTHSSANQQTSSRHSQAQHRLSSETPSESKSTPMEMDQEDVSIASSRMSPERKFTPVEKKVTTHRSKKLERHYTSSEEEPSDSAAMIQSVLSKKKAAALVEESGRSTKGNKAAKKAKVARALKKSIVTPEILAIVKPEMDREDTMESTDLVSSVATPTATATDTIDSEREEDIEEQVEPERIVKAKKPGGRQFTRDKSTPDPIDVGIAADEEDLYYIKLAIERSRRGLSLHPDPPLDFVYEFSPLARHISGAARTEGYYIITGAEKMANRPAADIKTVIEAPAAASGVAVSRLARANTRGLVRGMELHKKTTATDTDVLKFNQLRTRKKQLSFSRSGIHDYGLFAME
jgi:hypothetical protein